MIADVEELLAEIQQWLEYTFQDIVAGDLVKTAGDSEVEKPSLVRDLQMYRKFQLRFQRGHRAISTALDDHRFRVAKQELQAMTNELREISDEVFPSGTRELEAYGNWVYPVERILLALM